MNISICHRYELKKSEGARSKPREEDLFLARASDRRRFMVWMINVDFLSASGNLFLSRRKVSNDMKLSKLGFNMLRGNLSLSDELKTKNKLKTKLRGKKREGNSHAYVNSPDKFLLFFLVLNLK